MLAVHETASAELDPQPGTEGYLEDSERWMGGSFAPACLVLESELSRPGGKTAREGNTYERMMSAGMDRVEALVSQVRTKDVSIEVGRRWCGEGGGVLKDGCPSHRAWGQNKAASGGSKPDSGPDLEDEGARPLKEQPIAVFVELSLQP